MISHYFFWTLRTNAMTSVLSNFEFRFFFQNKVSFLCSLFVIVAFTAFPLPVNAQEKGHANPICVQTGIWQDLKGGTNIPETQLLDLMAKRPVVLLGESHTSAEHHRWQLHVLSSLYGRNPNMVLGFEAFPRVAQPVLDRWTRGELSEKKFLDMVRWDQVWRFDPGLYMPFFHFARMHRIPMRALNVERKFVQQVSKNGWASIAADQRRGIGNPLAPSKAYLDSLKEVFGLHREEDNERDKNAELSEEEKRKFKSFVEVQTIWDRAMAEAIADVSAAGGNPLVVAIVGRGHVEYGYGIPHQLADLGIDNAAVLLPWDRGLPCNELKAKDGTRVADAVFGISPPREADKPSKPRLGVQIENAEEDGQKGVGIAKVLEGSVADAAGLLKGDLIVEAAALRITKTRDLIKTIHRQSPGTWLPLRVFRNGKWLDIIAKFPADKEHPKR